MSYLWYFQSFSQERFDSFVADRSRLVASLQSQIEEYEEFLKKANEDANRREREKTFLQRFFERTRPPLVYKHSYPNAQAIYDHIGRHGLSYEGLSEGDAKTLDLFVINLSYETCVVQDELQMDVESHGGIHSVVIKEVIARGRGSCECPALELLVDGGRRIGSRMSHHCEYCLFNPDEVEAVRREVQCCLQSDAPWSTADIEEAVRVDLADVFSAFAKKGKAVFCTLG